MEKFAQKVLLESIKNGVISAAQKILQQIKKRGLEIIVKKQGTTEKPKRPPGRPGRTAT